MDKGNRDTGKQDLEAGDLLRLEEWPSQIEMALL